MIELVMVGQVDDSRQSKPQLVPPQTSRRLRLIAKTTRSARSADRWTSSWQQPLGEEYRGVSDHEI